MVYGKWNLYKIGRKSLLLELEIKESFMGKLASELYPPAPYTFPVPPMRKNVNCYGMNDPYRSIWGRRVCEPKRTEREHVGLLHVWHQHPPRKGNVRLHILSAFAEGGTMTACEADSVGEADTQHGCQKRLRFLLRNGLTLFLSWKVGTSLSPFYSSFRLKWSFCDFFYFQECC